MIQMKLNQAALENMVDPMWRREIPFTMSHAINRTLIASRKEQQKAMDKQIEGGPTRFTRTGIRYQSSKKNNLQGFLYYAADRPYMKTIIDGGQVIATRKKLSEPVNVKLDKFGNIPAGRGKNKYTARKKEDPKFFLGIPRGKTGERFRGIWQRLGKPGYTKKGKAKGRIKLMVSWARGSRQQRQSFNAYKVFEKHAPQYFRRQLLVSFRKAVRSSRQRPTPTGF